jgi:DNA mismatch endonuclease (patch repair protein)
LKEYPEQPIHVPRFHEENGFYTTRERSALMGKIKSKDTKAELKLRKALWCLGYRYRVNVKELPGRPDIVFRRHKLAIFIDGEFWHGYRWEEKKEKIKSNRGFWIPKIERNMQRDQANNRDLVDKGWQVMRFWEKEVHKDLEGCLERVLAHLSL